MAYIGNTAEQQAFTPAIDFFSGNGVTTAFTLSRPVASVAQVQATIENVPQNPGTAFTVSGNTITFDGAPASGTNNIYVYYTSPITTVATLSQDPVITGNMTYGSLGARIRGDFSNATVANRVMFQTSTANGITRVAAIPNGTATSAYFEVWNNSDTANANLFSLRSTATEAQLFTSFTGTPSSSYLPLTMYTGGSERLRIDTSGNVGIGTASPGSKLTLDGTLQIGAAGTASDVGITKIATRNIRFDSAPTAGTGITVNIGTNANQNSTFVVNGNALIGKTATNSLATIGVELQANGTTFITKTHPDGGGAGLYVNRLNVNGATVLFYKDTTEVGNIAVTGSATSYNSGSDYRLKNDIQPLTNALQKVALLKPSTWTWKADDTYGDGFIAHELSEVCPSAVTGEKDAVNEDGTIRPQGVDTSFLVATLTAAIQEQQALITQLQADVAELKGAK